MNQIPLIDLHLHIDGSVSVASARQLATMQGIGIPDSEEEVRALLEAGEDCRDLNEFLEKFEFPCSLLQTVEGLRLATKNLLLELKQDGVVYAELRFAPQKHTDKGLTQEEAVRAVLAGMQDLEQNAAQDTISSNLILCCMRGNDTDEANLETLRVAEQYLGKGVCAIDLAGAEALFSTGDYADLFSLARAKNIPFTIHAGEAAGAGSIEQALNFGCSRLGHGVRCVESKELMERIAKEQIPLELCPTSNLNTCVFAQLADYPLRKLIDAGVLVTINTDDMAVCGTNLRREFEKLEEEFALSRAEIQKLCENAIKASFAEKTQKESLVRKLHDVCGKMEM